MLSRRHRRRFRAGLRLQPGGVHGDHAVGVLLARLRLRVGEPHAARAVAPGVSLYCRFWKTGRPNGFFPCSGTVARTWPSRSMTKLASPLSRSASASHVSVLPFSRTFVGAGGGVASRHLRVLDVLHPRLRHRLVRQPRGLERFAGELRGRNRFAAGGRREPRLVRRHGDERIARGLRQPGAQAGVEPRDRQVTLVAAVVARQRIDGHADQPALAAHLVEERLVGGPHAREASCP